MGVTAKKQVPLFKLTACFENVPEIQNNILTIYLDKIGQTTLWSQSPSPCWK